MEKVIGIQTLPGATIKQRVAGFGVADSLRIYAAAEYVKALPIRRDRSWSKLFMQRTAEQIVSSGFATGCIDRALVFASLLRGTGYAARIVETIHRETLQGRVNRTGHAFVEVFLRNHGWLVLEPTTGEVISNITQNAAYIHLQTMPDFWSIGIANHRDFLVRFDDFANRTKFI